MKKYIVRLNDRYEVWRVYFNDKGEIYAEKKIAVAENQAEACNIVTAMNVYEDWVSPAN